MRKILLDLILEVYRITGLEPLEKYICNLYYVPYDLCVRDFLASFYVGNFKKKDLLLAFDIYLGLE